MKSMISCLIVTIEIYDWLIDEVIILLANWKLQPVIDYTWAIMIKLKLIDVKN